MDEFEELQELKDEKDNVLDEAYEDQTVSYDQYDITSYGADYDVDGLVKRMQRDDIFIPHFQREYVWNMNDASRFVESLLLGLPVPGVFMAKEPETNRLLVIDGQQRLKSLIFFFEGLFNPKPDQKKHRVFRLSNVQKKYEGLEYDNLEEKDRIRLGDAIIHATIIKQDTPSDDDTSIYHVFERLNTGGRKLVAQEMRAALYHGKLIKMIFSLNENESWRQIFRKHSSRMKDQELVLRFLALYFDWDKYTKPMSEFITKFAKRNRNPSVQFIEQCERLFDSTIGLVYSEIGSSAFRPERVLNAGVFDSIMVGLAKRLEKNEIDDPSKIKTVYDALIGDSEYNQMVSISTSDTVNVKGRIERAIVEFEKL